MSEAMSSADIEDVLSSIRRLVTGDLRPRGADAPAQAPAGTAGAAPAPAGPGEASGRLLLTPAFRVAPQGGEAPRPPVEGVLSVIGAHVAPPPAGFEPETGDAFSAAAEGVPPRPVAAVTAAPRTPADTFVFSNPRGRAPAAPADASAPAEAAAPADVAAPEDGQAEAPAAAAAPDRRLHVGKTCEDEEDTDEDILPEDVSPVVDLDEETLRELIRDVLREELQGPMGERITRNIRKLVRAELARAISFRNLG